MMATFDKIKKLMGDELDDETIAKCALVLDMATPAQVTPFKDRLPYTTLQQIVEYQEANK